MKDMEKKLALLLASSPHFMLKGGSSTYGKAAKDFIANGVVVRERGEWVKEPPYTSVGGEYKKGLLCSQCNSFFVSDGNTPWQLHNFCPNCGADMRKGENDGKAICRTGDL